MGCVGKNHAGGEMEEAKGWNPCGTELLGRKTLTYGWMKVVIGDVGDTPFLPPLESFR